MSQHKTLYDMVREAEMLARQYDFVVANPPYMGGKGMNKQLKEFAEKNFPDTKSDLFAMFIERNGEFARKNGYSGLITMQSWMFLSSFEKMRTNILAGKTLLSMAHLGPRAFDTIGGEVVSTTAFVNRNIALADYKGEYFRLIDFNSEAEKAEKHREAVKNPACGWFYRACADDFKKIPGGPIAYWVPNFQIFEYEKINKYYESGGRIKTHDGARFIRYIWEVERDSNKWHLLVKGGDFRKHYGNEDYLVDWSQAAISFYEEHGGLYPSRYMQKEGICWTKITSSIQSFRIKRDICEYDSAAPTIFNDAFNCDYYILSLLNSKVSHFILRAINPTMNTQLADVFAIPLCPEMNIEKKQVMQREEKCVSISQTDWDSYETSWDFSDVPLLRKDYRGKTLVETYKKLREHWRETTQEMQRLEEENNRIFIDAYGLQDELTSDVPLKEITLTCNPAYRYGGDATDEELETRLQTDTIKEFLSYAVGCAMGRYSLDLPGLVIASQGESLQDYSLKHNEALKWGVPTHENADPDDLLEVTQKHSSFLPDWDGIIPLLDREWFPDDMARRFEDFLIATFGKEHLKANLRFVEDSLGKSVRDYFAKDFFADHMKRYKKRPIYWLFSSGKQRAFHCIIYLHRYHAGTLSRMRTEYLVPLQSKISGRLEQIEMEKKSAGSTAAEKRLDKERDLLIKQADELRTYDEKLRHYADTKIELDLDDGVKVNYGKFGDLLASVKDITGEKPNTDI